MKNTDNFFTSYNIKTDAAYFHHLAPAQPHRTRTPLIYLSSLCLLSSIASRKSITKNNATLATFDAIITSWYKNGLKTQEEILNYEEQRKSLYIQAKKVTQ